MGSLLALWGRARLDLVVYSVAVEPSQAHKCISVRVVLNESVSSTPSCTSIFGNFATSRCFEDDFGLLDNTFALLLTHFLGDKHFLTATDDFLLVKFLTLALLNIGCEANDGATSKLLQVLRCDTAGNVAYRQASKGQVKRRILLDLLTSHCCALFAHLDFRGRELLV